MTSAPLLPARGSAQPPLLPLLLFGLLPTSWLRSASSASSPRRFSFATTTTTARARVLDSGLVDCPEHHACLDFGSHAVIAHYCHCDPTRSVQSWWLSAHAAALARGQPEASAVQQALALVVVGLVAVRMATMARAAP